MKPHSVSSAFNLLYLVNVFLLTYNSSINGVGWRLPQSPTHNKLPEISANVGNAKLTLKNK